MEENNEKNNETNVVEDLKDETTKTVEDFKETVKNMNIKDETKNTTNFVKDIFMNPIEKIKEIAMDSENKFLKIAIVLIAIWLIAEFVFSFATCNKYLSVGKNILNIVKDTITPLFTIGIMSLIIYILNKNNKKSISSIIVTITTVYIPKIIASVFYLLYLIDSQMGKITTPVNRLATVITAVLTFFAIKNIFEEDNEKVNIKNFVIVEAIFYVVSIVISFLGIYI